MGQSTSQNTDWSLIWGFPNIWNGWFKMDNRIKTDDWGVPPKLGNLHLDSGYIHTYIHIYIYIYMYVCMYVYIYIPNIGQPYVVFKLLLCFILWMIFMLFLRQQQILSRLASVVSSCVAHHPWVTTLTDGHSLRHHASPWAQE